MTARNENLQELVTRARKGDEAALVALFENRAQEILESLSSEACSAASVQQWQARTLDEAKRRSSEFGSTTLEEADQWFRAIAESQKDATSAAAPSPHDTIAPNTSVDTLGADAYATVIGRPAKAPPPGDRPDDDAKTVDFEPSPGGADAQTAADPLATIAGMAKPAAPPPPEGNKIFGDYEILETIARGGMGVVYKARQRKLNRVVALKMILAGQFADQSDVDRFYVEAEASANLRHPNIVGIYEVGECEGQHYFSMDYIEGKGLDGLVREHALAPHRAARFVKTISEAMHYAHEKGILHRDLKPSNVLIDQNNEPLITDFGLAKRTEGQSQLTMSGTVVGTPAYMPPEQASGKLEQIDVRSDVYSLGAILYELLTGRPPFMSANPFETINQVLDTDPVSPRILNSGIPVDLDTITMKCLQKEQDRRYATAQDLVDELQRFLSGEPILARPVTTLERAWRWCMRNPRVAASSAVAATTLFVASIGFSILWFRAEVARQNEQSARKQTEAALAKAETSIDQMRIAIDELYRIVAEEELLNEPGFKPIRHKILSQARDLYRQALDRLGDDPKIKEDMAVSLFSLGRILRELEEPEEALEPLHKARTIQMSLLEAAPDSTDRIQNLGNTINLIGQVYENQQHLAEALVVYDEAIKLRQELVDRDPDNIEFQRQLMNSQMNSGLIHKKVFDQGNEEHYQLAMERLRESQENRNKLLVATPDDARLHRDAAIGSYNYASLTFLKLEDLRAEMMWMDEQLIALDEKDEPTEAEQQQAQKLRLQIETLREQAAECQKRTTALLATAFDELEFLQHGTEGQQLKGLKQVDIFQVRQLEAYCLLLAAYVTDDESTAATSVQRAREIVEVLVSENHESHEFLSALGGVYMLIGDLHFTRYEDQKAIEAYRRTVALFEQLVQDVPGAMRYEAQLSAARTRLKEIEAEISGPPEEASNEPNE